MNSALRYALDDSLVDSVFDEIGQLTSLDAPVDEVRTLTLLDTFDGRLRRDDGILVAEAHDEGCWLRWVELDLRTERGALEVETLPRFAWDLPAGPLRARLARRLDLRALLPIAHVREDRRVAAARDRRGLAIGWVEVVRCHLRSARLREPRSLAPQLLVTAARGRSKWLRRLDEELRRRLPHDPDPRPWADRLAEAAGHRPGAHPGRSRPLLDPGLEALEGHRRVYDALVHDLEANEAGTKADLDSEFLHDYRVALRRLRACLAFSSDWVESEERARLEDELRWLSGCTGDTRDLDVHLLALPALGRRLSAAERSALVPHHHFVAGRQRSAQARMAAAMESARYHRLKRQLRRACATAEAPAPVLLGNAVGDRLRREYRRVRRAGRKAGPHADEVRLHELRKRAKRLRAVIDVFPGVIAEPDAKALRKEIRRLLSKLGGLQDVVVHLRTVEMSAQHQREPAATTLLALGALRDLLQAEHEDRLAEARLAVARFDRPAVHRSFRRVWRALRAGSASHEGVPS